jgi:hypothetical protein
MLERNLEDILPEVKENRYGQLLEHIFFDKHFGSYRKGLRTIEFEREDLERAANVLKIKLPKNQGDVIYSFRYRASLPKTILATQPKGMEWIIDGAGRAPLQVLPSSVKSHPAQSGAESG